MVDRGRVGAMNRLACAVLIFGGWLAATGCGGGAKRSNPPAGQVCEPGVKSCSGSEVQVCSDDGATRSVVETCSQTELCRGGECTKADCVPDTNFCQDDSVWTCDSHGAKLLQPCAAGETCRVVDDDAICAPPGDTPACSPGSEFCQNGSLHLCEPNGRDATVLLNCGPDRVCDGAVNACVPKVCEAERQGCDQDRIAQCNAFGSGWETIITDCAAAGAVCIAGECQAHGCKPDAMFCGDDGNVYRCSSDGKSSSLWVHCVATSYRCVELPNTDTAGCDYDSCTPFEVGCDGNTIRTCTAEGMWPAEGTDCARDQYCKDGSCVDRFCDPGAMFCQDNGIYSCSTLGDGVSLLLQCPADSECQEETGGCSCRPLPCAPGQPACLGEKIGSCAADGKTLASISADCAADGLVCDPNDTCASAAIDTLGDAESSRTEPTGFVVGSLVEANTSRALTEMQLDMVLAAPGELRWCVFEVTGSELSGYPLLERKQEWLRTAQAGNGFLSSGPISFNVEAGKTYLFGVAIASGISPVTVIDEEPFQRNVSFGRVVGSFQNAYAEAINDAIIDTGRVYRMRLSTAPAAVQ